jgi:hypothetical protein
MKFWHPDFCKTTYSLATFVTLYALGLGVGAAQSCSLNIVTQPRLFIPSDFGYKVVISVEVDGTPPISYQWYKYSAERMPIEGATNACYEAMLSESLTGYFDVQVSNVCGQLQSSWAFVTPYQDTLAPWVTSLVALATNRLAVMFTDPVFPGEGTNYVLVPARTVTEVRTNASDPSLIELILASETPLVEGAVYHLSVRGIMDQSGNILDQNRSETSFVAEGLLPGTGPPKLRLVVLKPWDYYHPNRKFLVQWTGGGVLQGTFDLNGRWEDLSAGASPYVINLTGEACHPPPRFFRVRTAN